MRRCWIPSRLAGVATEDGGAEDHTSVMLRALGVPAVLGAAGLAHAIQPGDIAVIDGTAGTVVLNPGSNTLTAARRALTAFARERQRYAKLRRLPAETLDGEIGRVAGQSGIAARIAADRPIRRASALGCCAPSSCS